MKNRYAFIFVALAALFICITACARQRDYGTPTPYIPHPKGEFPIVATYAFTMPYLNDRQMEWVKEAGFNVLTQAQTKAELDSILVLVARHDLYTYARPEGIRDTTKMAGLMREYGSNPRVWMFSLYDEPKASQFPYLKRLREIASANGPRQNALINLLPAIDPKGLEADSYRDYVEEFVETVNPSFISFDIYPVKKRKNGEIYVDPVTYPSYEVIADVARKSHRPFWSYILSNEHWMYPKPKTEYIRFSVFTALGYGAQGLQYYTYCMPDFDKNAGEYSNAPIDWDGNRTDVWYMVRDVNREVRNLEHVFLGAETVSVTHTGKQIPASTRRTDTLPAPFRIIESNGEGVMVSHLRNGNKNYLLLVNRDVLNKQKVYLSRTKPVTRLYGNGKRKTDKGPNLTLDPGGYALFEF